MIRISSPSEFTHEQFQAVEEHFKVYVCKQFSATAFKHEPLYTSDHLKIKKYKHNRKKKRK